MEESNTILPNEEVAETLAEVVKDSEPGVPVEEAPVIEVESMETLAEVSGVKKYSGKLIQSYNDGVITLETGEKMNLSQEEYDEIKYVAG